MVFLVNLRNCMGPDELIFMDVSASTHWASEGIEVWGPRRYFTPANNQSMGWAVPASIEVREVRLDPSRGVRHRRRLLPDVGSRSLDWLLERDLPVKFFHGMLDDGAYHYMRRCCRSPRSAARRPPRSPASISRQLASRAQSGYNCILP